MDTFVAILVIFGAAVLGYSQANRDWVQYSDRPVAKRSDGKNYWVIEHSNQMELCERVRMFEQWQEQKANEKEVWQDSQQHQ